MNFLKSKSGRRNEETCPPTMTPSQILWSDIIVDATKKEDCILRRSSSGGTFIIKAVWKSKNRDVAIKLLTRHHAQLMNGNPSFEDMSKKVWTEMDLMKEAEHSLVGSDCIVKVYGVVEGVLPDKLLKLFELPAGDEGVGAVMKYERGGSLENLLYSDFKPNLQLIEKIRLLSEIANGLSELHSYGIIHADIKPANILLSHHNPPEIRLTDFKMSLMKDIDQLQLGGSSLQMIEMRNKREMSAYSAPETLTDPFAENSDGKIAQFSRKTDMYSFGILAWEVLARKRPFADVRNQTMLCGKVHKGQRPPINELPPDTPPEVVMLIESCWDKVRANRKIAAQCLVTLQLSVDIMSQNQFDIFFSHAWLDKPLLCNVYHILTKHGYRVWYDQNDMGHDLHESVRRGINSSKVVIACINQKYQSRESCLYELRSASEKPILTLVTDDDPLSWAIPEVHDRCKLRSRLYVSVAQVAKMDWENEDGPTPEMMQSLTSSIETLIRLLPELGCLPSMSPRQLSRQSSFTLSSRSNSNNTNNSSSSSSSNTANQISPISTPK